MTLVCSSEEWKGCKITEASTQIPKEILGGWGQGGHGWVSPRSTLLCETGEKAEMLWRQCRAGDARGLAELPRKPMSSERRQPRKEAVCTAAGKARGARYMP